MEEKIVLFIDEDESNHRNLKRKITKLYGDSFRVEVKVPENSLEEAVRVIQGYGEGLASLMLDERLHETGVCNFSGTELANVYRTYDNLIPIYILTSHPGMKQSGVYEYVISKNDLYESEEVRTMLSQRLRRHVNQFLHIRDGRFQRLEELVRKSINSTLNGAEEAEFMDLKTWRLSPTELDEIQETKAMREWIDGQETILAEIERTIGDDSKGVGG
jgi:hypothetical protein